MLQQTSPSGLTCATEPKTFVLTGRANYPDNAFLIKNQLRAKLRDFPFAQASAASEFSGKEGAWRFPAHILLPTVHTWTWALTFPPEKQQELCAFL